MATVGSPDEVVVAASSELECRSAVLVNGDGGGVVAALVLEWSAAAAVAAAMRAKKQPVCFENVLRVVLVLVAGVDNCCTTVNALFLERSKEKK